MKVLVAPCSECQQASLPSSWTLQQVSQTQIYRPQCSAGHKLVIQDQFESFDILYKSAINAMVDGYYREAVASFMASLERFREYYFKAIMFKHRVPETQVNAAWGIVESQSERQLGWFIGVYLLDNMVPPMDIESKARVNGKPFSSFRNGVIHKGAIPDRKGAIDFGQIVYDYIIGILHSDKFFSDLNGNACSAYYIMQHRNIRLLEESAGKLYPDCRVGHQGGTTFLTDTRIALTVEGQMASIVEERKIKRPTFP